MEIPTGTSKTIFQTMATKLSLKLLIETTTGKVLFGEADKAFVDFLFSLLALPIGLVAKLVSGESKLGCMNLYESLQNLTDDYMQPNVNKDTLLNPKVVTSTIGPSCLLLKGDSPATSLKYYQCSYHSNIVTHVRGMKCTSCNERMDKEVRFIEPRTAGSGPEGEGGYVKGVVTYMVMDDLVVKPMSTISSITLINKLNVRDVSALKEKVVQVGMEEGVALLKASLESDQAVLTKVFGKKLVVIEQDQAFPSEG